MDRIGIIQLSDLQFGKIHRFGNPSNIGTKLSDDICRMAEKHVFIPAYLILSGDITEIGIVSEFDQALNQLKIISSNISIDTHSILTVPGNHDVNWDLAEVSTKVGDPYIKYNNYQNFISKLTERQIRLDTDSYTISIDSQLGLSFLMLNSCEKEDKNNHKGYVNIDKLLASIKFLCQDPQINRYTKICILHHRIDTTISDCRAACENASEVEAILYANNFNIVLSGHVHQCISHEVKKDGKTIIYSGAGTTGADKSQREDGIQNQYSIHVLDVNNKTVETFWRAYNPLRKTHLGLGGWAEDNSISENPTSHSLPSLENNFKIYDDYIVDSLLVKTLALQANPFTFSNAEKLNSNRILDLFVSSETRHKGAMRLVGDAIIRGKKGSGKTMLLKWLDIYGNIQFDNSIKDKQIAETFPVFVNLDRIHKSEWGGSIDSIFSSADKLIYDAVIDALEQKSKKLVSTAFRAALFRMKQRILTLQHQDGSLIAKLGIAIQDTMGDFFKHILLLIDEIAPVFPTEFFTNEDNGFLAWMNAIRNSGPYFTRVAVYPNAISDVLNEDRFGTLVNLDYDIKIEDEYLAYRSYCIELINKYLKNMAVNKDKAPTINNVIFAPDNSSEDALEQLLYASDGSSRRFLSLMDRCLNYIVSKKVNKCTLYLDKTDAIAVINEFASNLLSSYQKSEQELAISIAKVCRRQSTYRFKLPGFSGPLSPLYSSREELNIMRQVIAGTGRAGTLYEFTYPYCILMEIQSHNLKDTRRTCPSRDHVTGEWVTQVTTIKKEHLDIYNKVERVEGAVIEIGFDLILVKTIDNKTYLSQDFPLDLEVGNIITFIVEDTFAIEILKK